MNELMRTILNLPPQASTVAKEVDALHYFVITVTMFGAAAVAFATFVFIVRYRRGAGRHEDQAPAAGARTSGGIPYWLELGVIGFLLSLFVLWWVLGFRQYMKLQTAPAGAMDVYVVGKKWMWTFVYPDGSSSNAVLYVPANRPVRLVMSSRDVIHSFFVPAFRVKQDVLPGRVTTLWFEANRPGEYPLFCTEYCGTGHSTMRGRVVVLDDGEYEAQLERLPAADLPRSTLATRAEGAAGRTPATLADIGESVATVHGCFRCHTVDGTPHIGPTWARMFGSTVTLRTGERVEADPAYITESMMDPLAKLRPGYQPVMPAYQGLITAAETGAIVEYIRSLRDRPPGARTAPAPLPVRVEEASAP